jgi:oligopeptide/dipeptide ABC transporter ATP-binding protein
VAVMYLGRIVETASADALFANPRHPYTRALLSAIPLPRPRARRNRQLLEGDVPSPIAPPPGCHLHPRCAYAIERCKIERPLLIDDADSHATACHRWSELPAMAALAEEDRPASGLDPLIAAFTAMKDVRASGGVDTVGMAGQAGRPVLSDK